MRRVSGWKVTGLFLGLLAAVAGTIWLWVETAAARKWAAMEKRVEELAAEAQSRHSARPVLRGHGVGGNAWDEYSLAIEDAGKIRPSNVVPQESPNSTLFEYLSRGANANRSKVEKILGAHSVAIDHLKRGARRAASQYPFDWEEGITPKGPEVVSCGKLVILTLCHARFLAEAGNHRQAVELILDVCQFGRDLVHNGRFLDELSSIHLLGRALEELRDLLVSGQFSPELLSQLARELEILDRSFPRSAHGLSNGALALGRSFLGPRAAYLQLIAGWSASIPDLEKDISRAMRRYAFSMRLMMSDAFNTFTRQTLRCAQYEDKPWPELQKISADWMQEARNPRNPLLREMWVPPPEATFGAARECRSQLRLLRIAVHYLSTGEVLDLDDPFGTKLRTLEAGNELKVWSLGRDGSDQGGTGGWKWKRGSDMDLVIEVKRTN